MLLVSGFTITSFAQDGDDDASFQNGFKAGWQSSNMYNNGSAHADNLSSFYLGIFSEGKITPLFRVGSSLEYFQNGFQSDGGTFKMHTISLPLYLKAKLGPVFGTAGIAANFKLGDNRENFPNVITNTNFFDLPVSLGLGMKFLVFQIEAKYSWGLFEAATINAYPYKNQYVQDGASIIL